MSDVCTTPQLLLEDEPSLFGTDCTSVVGGIFRDPCPAVAATTTPSTPAATTGSPWRDADRDPRTRNTPKAPLQIQPTEDELAWCRRRLFAGCTPRLHPNAIGLRTPETPRKRCRDDDGDTALRRSKRLRTRPFRHWLGVGWVYSRDGDPELRPGRIPGRITYRALAAR